MTEPTEEENIAAGMERLESLADSLEKELVEAAGGAEFADRARRQPWLLAGVSDGMGLHVTVAAIEAGLLEHGVGVYYEPPALLKLDDDGEPVSAVHWARYQNALALEKFAEQRGVDLTVLSADVLLAPQRGLKGEVKGEMPEFPEEVREAFEEARKRAPESDAVFIDSVAFGKWISPREGNEPVEVPNVDFEGRIVSSKPKKYHVRGYEETLDTMGRNHGRLLERFREFGWLGEDALTAFFTWAGGSQNVEVLEGIYGRGSLGDAKIIAERDVVEFRLEHGLDHGEHAIVRLPAFLSAALMAIPGGGLFGLVSRKTLRDHGMHWDMPELAARMLRRLFGPEWVRTNPLAQIELDSNERLYMDEISERVEEAHDAIEAYRRDQSEEERREPIPADESAEILEGLVPWNYRSVLGRFRPEEDVEARRAEFEIELGAGPFRSPHHSPVGAGAAAALGAVSDRIDLGAEEFESLRDRFEADPDADWSVVGGGSTSPRVVRGSVEIEKAPEGLRIVRRLFDGSGHRLGEGVTTLAESPSDLEVPDWLGEPAGSRLEISGDVVETLLERADADRDALAGAATCGFAEAALIGSGRARASARSLDCTVAVDSLPSDGGSLTTYARREDDVLEATVVDSDGTAVARVRYRDE